MEHKKPHRGRAAAAGAAKAQMKSSFFNKMLREPANLQYLEDKIICFFRMQDANVQEATGESILIPEAELRQLARAALEKNSDKEKTARAVAMFAKEILTENDIRLILSFFGSVKNSERIANSWQRISSSTKSHIKEFMVSLKAGQPLPWSYPGCSSSR